MSLIFSKASGVNNSVFGKSQEPIRMMLENEQQSWESKSMIEKVFVKESTDKFAEKYTSMTSLGQFAPVGEGGAYPRSSIREGYSKVIEPEEWKNSFAVTQTMLEDGNLARELVTRGKLFVQAWGLTRENFAAGLLTASAIGTTYSVNINGTNKSFDISGADTKALFATDHPSITGETTAQSNLFDADFSYDTLLQVEELMQKFKDDNGNLLNINPDTIIIPNNARIKKAVFGALNAEGIPGSANNDANIHLGRWNIVVWNYLKNPTGITSGKDWWIVTDRNYVETHSALVFLDRVDLSVHSWIDENTGDNVFNGRGRFGAAPVNWRGFAAAVPGLSGATSVSAFA